MDARRSTSAEKTAAIISHAVQTGASLCIPGAREHRVERPVSQAAPAAGGSAPVDAAAGTASDVERREYERAGGGAPAGRGMTRRPNLIERLSRLLH